MKSAIFAGSFDPPTIGHVDILNRSLKIFDKVFIPILKNPEKKTFFSEQERQAFLTKIANEIDPKRIEVHCFNGLLVEFAKKVGTSNVVRGIRDSKDLSYELDMYNINRYLFSEIETIFLPTKPENASVSSMAVRQVMSFGGNISGLVPECIRYDIENKIKVGGKINES